MTREHPRATEQPKYSISDTSSNIDTVYQILLKHIKFAVRHGGLQTERPGYEPWLCSLFRVHWCSGVYIGRGEFNVGLSPSMD